MKKQLAINLVILLVAISPIGYLLMVWDSIPPTFVTKFELNRSFEQIQTRQELLIATSILAVVSGLLYLLMGNLKKIDPKVKESTPKSSFLRLGLIVTLFLVAMNYFLILSAKNAWVMNTKTVLVFFGLLVLLMGNYMNNLKPNYIAGIRLPWTLKDPDNWRRTHQLAGKLWFAGGALLIILGLALPKNLLIPFMIAVLITIVVIPGIYSYSIYRRKLS